MEKFSIVTGGASGLGFEFVKLLLIDKYNVVVIDNDKKELNNIKSKINFKHNKKIILMHKDLSNPDSSIEIFKELKNKNIEVLINNAGFGLFGKFKDTNWKIERNMIMVHVMCTTEMTKLFLNNMIENKKGRILNMASLAAFQPGPLMSIYYSTKAFILHFSESIANELKGSGVSVTVLCPGQTRTNFQKKVSSREKKINFNFSTAEEVAKYGYDAMMNGKTIAIPGIINKILSTIHRFIPRSFATKLMRKIQEKNRNS
tara:strand:- start:115 stop:891 length:777 start_codon:yes stop_codon:yes gene_type:complete